MTDKQIFVIRSQEFKINHTEFPSVIGGISEEAIWSCPKTCDENLNVLVCSREAASIAHITRGHVWRLCRSGKWPHFIISGKFFVSREIAELYRPEKPGPKLGQKINRREK